ncbi:hypothetical protein WKH56_19550 [Priestia sp. SB1]|uniref:hypothetical protein n=1 Tax=Priestia sp. SB1 TaxID=3132359 RepID=UPI00316E62B8
MKLRKGDLIRVHMSSESREGMITELDFKNGMRVYSYGDWWCYREQVNEVFRNGEWIKFKKG